MVGESLRWGRLGCQLVLASVLYGLFSWAWPLVSGSYQPFVRWGASTLFQDCGENREAKLVALEDGLEKDSLLVFQPSDAPERFGATGVNTEHLAYRPAALLAALVLASRVSWRKRSLALVLGLAGIHVFIALRIGVMLAVSFSRFLVEGEPLLDLRALPEPLLETAVVLIWKEPTANYVVPLLLWALLVLPSLLAEPGTTATPAPPAAPGARAGAGETREPGLHGEREQGERA